MREAKRIADQMRRSQHGESWHGPPLDEILPDVTAERAARRVLPDVHTIWELVLHVIAWEGVALRQLAGEPAPELPWEGNWPAVPVVSDANWKATVKDAQRINAELAAAIEQLDDARLEERAPGRDFSIYFLLHGVVQHNLYHAGQMALLKKG
jgi:hypothetical protein